MTTSKLYQMNYYPSTRTIEQSAFQMISSPSKI